MVLENVIEEYQMIDLINTYLNTPTFKPCMLGGVVGTTLFEHVFNACMEQFQYNRICIIEGIQDYIGMKKQNPNYHNHFFYAEGFLNDFIINNEYPFALESYMYNHRVSYKVPIINLKYVNDYDIFIINDAHLIPDEYLQQLLNMRKKMFVLVDPFDINGERYYHVPTIIDTMKRLPALLVRARALYNIDTRAYDKSTQMTFTRGKVSKRSIGKLGDTMYSSNDDDIIKYAHNKQLVAPSKKNHRMMVIDTYTSRPMELNPNPRSVVTKYSLLQVVNQHKTRNLYNFRIHSSNSNIVTTMSYDKTTPKTEIHVIPANILLPEHIAHHRFKNVVYVHGNSKPNIREMYTLMKCTRNLIID